MKTFMKSAALAALVILPAMGAQAAGWYIADLGEVPGERDACMALARNTLMTYMFDNGMAETSTGSWTTYAYGLEPGGHDVVITCPIVNGGVVNGFMSLHSDSTNENRDFTGEEIERIWDSLR